METHAQTLAVQIYNAYFTTSLKRFDELPRQLRDDINKAEAVIGEIGGKLMSRQVIYLMVEQYDRRRPII